jgi:2-polyprenyl-6-methoxyphenol hydroxylase-like FAD-dependent oxidoreductase
MARIVSRLGSRAVVVGAGIGGLTAAASVAPFFDDVTVLDGDELPENAVTRKAVAQGQHLHTLLKGGELFIEDLLPGTRAKFLAAGACEMKRDENFLVYDRGYSYPRRDIGFSQLGLSRPAFENVVRSQVKGIANIRIHDRTPVNSLIIENGSLIGLRTSDGDGERVELADLFIIACGRNNFHEAALAKAGLGPIPATKLVVEVHYTTGRFAKPPQFKGESNFVIYFPKPPEIAMGLLTPVENDEWVVTLGGRFDQRAPTDLAGFRAYAAQLTADDIAKRISDAPLLQPLRSYRMNSAIWHHYDRYTNLPGRLIPLGDCISSFNPTFGQGMTVAAGHALALRNALTRMSDAGKGLNSLADAYFPKAMKLTQQAWNGAATVDMEYEQTLGERPAEHHKAVDWMEAMRRAALRHPDAQRLRMEIGHFLKPPTASRQGPIAQLIAAELPANPRPPRLS